MEKTATVEIESGRSGVLRLYGFPEDAEGRSAAGEAFQHYAIGGKQLAHLGGVLISAAIGNLMSGRSFKTTASGARAELVGFDGGPADRPIRGWEDVGDYGSDLAKFGQSITRDDDPDHEDKSADPGSCWHFESEVRQLSA